MADLIHIQPVPERRRAFAQWAVAQAPKLRTVGPNVFAVPAELFTRAPEEILIGALVDGRRYVSPEEDAQEGRAAPGELLGVAVPHGLYFLPMREAVPGEPLPELPPEAYGPDAVPLTVADEEGTELVAEAYGPDSVALTVVGEEGPELYVPLDAGSDSSDQADEGAEPADRAEGFPCDLCTRSYRTERGRDSHRRQKHPGA